MSEYGFALEEKLKKKREVLEQKKDKKRVHKIFRVGSGLTEAEIVEIQKSVHNEFDKLEKFFAEAFEIGGRCSNCSND